MVFMRSRVKTFFENVFTKTNIVSGVFLGLSTKLRESRGNNKKVLVMTSWWSCEKFVCVLGEGDAVFFGVLGWLEERQSEFFARQILK